MSLYTNSTEDGVAAAKKLVMLLDHDDSELQKQIKVAQDVSSKVLGSLRAGIAAHEYGELTTLAKTESPATNTYVFAPIAKLLVPTDATAAEYTVYNMVPFLNTCKAELDKMDAAQVRTIQQNFAPRYEWLCGNPDALPHWAVMIKDGAGEPHHVPILNFIVAPLLMDATKKSLALSRCKLDDLNNQVLHDAKNHIRDFWPYSEQILFAVA